MRAPAGDAGPVDALLARLRRGLPGRRFGIGADLLAELRDGLRDSTDAYRRAGLSAQQAELRAVRDFGDPDLVLDSCRQQIGLRAGLRSTKLVALGFGLLLGCWWLYYLVFAGARRMDTGTLRTAAAEVPVVGVVVQLLSALDSLGIAVGNGFSAIGVAAAGLSLFTGLRMRRLARREARCSPITVAVFAIGTLLAVASTFLLSAAIGSDPDRSATAIMVERVAQLLSVLIMAAVTVAAFSALRFGLAGRWRRRSAEHRSVASAEMRLTQ